MGVREYNEKRKASNERYDVKTYKQFNIKLRISDDNEIIESIQQAVREHKPVREWLSELYHGGTVLTFSDDVENFIASRGESGQTRAELIDIAMEEYARSSGYR